MGTSTYLGNAIVNAIVNATSFSLAGNPYVSLHTGDPGITGANEVSGGSYARQQTGFNAAASKAGANTASITFSSMPTATVTYVGLWDASTSGNFLGGGELSESVSVSVGNPLVLAAEHVILAVA